jgi:UDP-N-acetylmuramate dehydrogenase
MTTAVLRPNEREPTAGFGATLRAAFAERFGARARFDEPLSRHTSFHIGGPADAWVDVENIAELSDIFALARAGEAGSPVFILGSGTNVLVSDRGVRGIVVHLGRGFRFVEWTVVYDAVDRGFTGLEFGEGIPGSLGGGLTMNAGAFGSEIGRVVECLEGVHPDGRIEELPRARLAFEYRRLELPPGWIITGVRLRLERGDAVEMKTRVAAAREKRKKNQPLGVPNAGSIFKNPPGAFAGRLLEDAGVKGLERGGARVSERHANFIVNQGGATADDVRSLMKEMGERVYERSGIRLQPEVKLLGDW